MRKRPEAPGPMRLDLIPIYVRWINDIEIARFAGMVKPATAEQETRAMVLTVPSPAPSDMRRGSRG